MMHRRAFIRSVIVATLAAPLLARAEEARYRGLCKRIRAFLDAHDWPLEIRVGSEAINCYGRGLERHNTVQSKAILPVHIPANLVNLPIYRVTRLIFDPSLGPWELSA